MLWESFINFDPSFGQRTMLTSTPVERLSSHVMRFHLLDVDSVARDQDVAFLEALATVGYQCARADSAPGDVICTDAGEVLRWSGMEQDCWNTSWL